MKEYEVVVQEITEHTVRAFAGSRSEVSERVLVEDCEHIRSIRKAPKITEIVASPSAKKQEGCEDE